MKRVLLVTVCVVFALSLPHVLDADFGLRGFRLDLGFPFEAFSLQRGMFQPEAPGEVWLVIPRLGGIAGNLVLLSLTLYLIRRVLLRRQPASRNTPVEAETTEDEAQTGPRG
jgi:hypothetical protein